MIHCDLSYAQSLIDDFSQPTKAPHIAISVDMLDTGIDVPEVVNLVFFKLVRSKTKFWQMLGRGTRLSPDLHGPGQNKEFFTVFDYCGNLEFFRQNPDTTEGSLAASLSKRLFTARLELISTIDRELDSRAVVSESPDPLYLLRCDSAAMLHREVAAMKLENFVVRPQRRLVEKYASADAWTALTGEAIGELADRVAGLPSALETEEEEAKRFDLLLLQLQLAHLRSEPGFARLRDQVKAIAGLLEEQTGIPMVQAQMALILDLQTDEWWRDATVPMMEDVRKRLRLLVKLIEKRRRKPVYTDFEDELGEATPVDLPSFAAPQAYERFQAKARQFLKAHEDHIAVHKLRTNEPLTTTDLAELERMFLESGIGTEEELQRAKQENCGFGLFVRSLVGMDRQTAKKALGSFLTGRTLKRAQIQFLHEVVNHLTERGCLEPARLYESPFVDFSPTGVDGIFTSQQVEELVAILEQVRLRATA